MNAVRIRKRVDSDTLHLPELRPLIGKEVEIIVREEPAAQVEFQDLTPVHEAAGKIDLDWDAIEHLRDISKL